MDDGNVELAPSLLLSEEESYVQNDGENANEALLVENSFAVNTRGKSVASKDNGQSPDRSTSETLLFLLLFPSFLEAVAECMSIPVLPVFAQQDLQASHTMIGTIIASMALGKLLCNIPSGWLVSLFYSGSNMNDCKTVNRILQTQSQQHWYSLIPLIISSLTLASAYVGAAFVTTPTGLILARLWEGAGLSLWVIGRQTLTNDLVATETRGRYMATLGGTSRLASIFGPYFGGVLATRWSFRLPFFGQALLCVVNAVLLGLIVLWSIKAANSSEVHHSGYDAVPTSSCLVGEVDAKEENATLLNEAKQDNGPTSSNLKATSADTMSWVELLSTFGLTMAVVAVFCFCTAVVRQSRHLLFPLKAMEMGYDAHAIGIMTSITYILDALMFPVAGYLMDHFGRKYSGIPAHVVMGISSASVPILSKYYPSSFLALTLASSGCGIGNGLSSGLIMSLGGDLSPPQGQNRAKFLALFRNFADTGLLLGPWVSGKIADQFSVTAGFDVLASTAFVAALWMLFVMPETVTG